MRTIEISLPDELMAFVEEELKNGAYSDASEYLEEWIAHHEQESARSRLEALLVEGLKSGPERSSRARAGPKECVALNCGSAPSRM